MTVKPTTARLGLAFLAMLALLTFVSGPALAQQQNQANFSRIAGSFVAAQYNNWRTTVASGFTSTGTQTMTVNSPTVALPDGRVIVPWNVGAVINVGPAGSTSENVTITGASGCSLGSTSCTVTASFTNVHGAGEIVQAGDGGVSFAAWDANQNGGGVVEVDSTFRGTLAGILAVPPFGNVSIVDVRTNAPIYYTPQPTTSTVIAAPATLTAATVGFGLNGANTTSGTYAGASTYHYAIACVSITGEESQPSADFSAATAGTGSTNQIGFAAPAAQTGCVGWVPYISLAGGTYALSYRVPVATYSNGVATSNGVCTGGLTTLETITAACKITNATYGQTGSAAVVSALTVNTARIWVGTGGTSTTADIVGNTNARQTYAYTASGSSAPGIPGIARAPLAFTAATAPATTVPAIVGTITIPPAYMNQVGRAIRISGTLVFAAGSTATIESVKFYWNADGSNTTGAGVLIPGTTATTTFSATPGMTFSQVLQTTAAGASATSGSIQNTTGYQLSSNGAAGTAGVVAPTQPAATTASLNLAQEARIDIDYLHTTGTDGTVQLVGLVVEAVN